MPDEQCTWCGEEVEPNDGWRAVEPAGERTATFCRLEHVVPWAMNGARWSAGVLSEPGDVLESSNECAQCGRELGDTRVVLVRHRGDHRVPDGFCSVDHMAEWAKRGGRWAPAG